jgi:hypothetical protein
VEDLAAMLSYLSLKPFLWQLHPVTLARNACAVHLDEVYRLGDIS